MIFSLNEETVLFWIRYLDDFYYMTSIFQVGKLHPHVGESSMAIINGFKSWTFRNLNPIKLDAIFKITRKGPRPKFWNALALSGEDSLISSLQYPLCAMIPELNGSLPTLYYEKNRVTSELLSERSIPMKFLVYICHINIFWFGGKLFFWCVIPVQSMNLENEGNIKFQLEIENNAK